jgi:3-phosphoshikimate 1-carboxyvinyltransferase
MNDLTVAPSQPLRGRIEVPGDKSISHRALLLGAIAQGDSHVEGFLPSGDCRATLHAVRALGVGVTEHSPADLVVHGKGLHGLREPEDVIDCVRSGTTMRLLAGLLAGQPFTSTLYGAEQLRERPMGRITVPLREMGATILGRKDGRHAPLSIRGGSLVGIEYVLPVASAQLKSALLLAGLFAEGPTIIHEPGPARDHTERMLQAMDCDLNSAGGKLVLLPGRPLKSIDFSVPGDFSSAAFLMVAASVVPGSRITIADVGVNPTRTGLLDVLRSMGASIQLRGERLAGGEPVADIEVEYSKLRGTSISGDLVVRTIDELPVLAVAASQAEGETVLRDAGELRVKETDRIATTVEELGRLGADIQAQADGFIVRGPTPLHCRAGDHNGTVHSHGDHRLAMALAVAGLVAAGETRIHDTACIDDSFPGFADRLRTLGAA